MNNIKNYSLHDTLKDAWSAHWNLTLQANSDHQVGSFVPLLDVCIAALGTGL